MSVNKWFCSLFVVGVFLVTAASTLKSDEEKEALLADKVQKLTAWSSKKAVIRLTFERFSQYLKKAPRNYSVIVMLTALKPERKCMMCSGADEEFQILANSWRYSPHRSSSLFFAMVDYDEASSIFHDLQISTVPVYMHFPAKGKQKKADIMQNQADWKAEDLATWTKQRTGIQIQVWRPINYMYVVTAVALVSVTGAVLFCLRNRLHLIFNRICLAILIVTVIFAFISGYMWNRIRHPPKMLKNPRTGETIYIHPQRGSQFVMETYIIMLLHGSMLAGFIMMNEVSSLKWRWARMLLAVAGLACFITFFIVLLTVFKTKSPYYPYGFFDLLDKYVWRK